MEIRKENEVVAMTVHCTHDEPGIGNGLISQVNFKMDPSQHSVISSGYAVEMKRNAVSTFL